MGSGKRNYRSMRAKYKKSTQKNVKETEENKEIDKEYIDHLRELFNKK